MQALMRTVLLAAALALGSTVHTQTAEARPMTDAEYKTFLSQLDAALPRLEAALKVIDKRSGGAHNGQPGLVEIHDIRVLYLDPGHRRTRTLSNELDLCGYLQRLDINIAVSGIYAPEMNNFVFRLSDDVHAQLAHL